VLVRPGSASIAPTVIGLPFGAGGDERVGTTMSLESGEAVVAITDGLVERRGEDIDVGIGRLLDATATARWTTAQALVRRMVDAASRHGMPDDDVTVLVLRRE